MTSVISFPRRLLGLWSPRIHLMASTTLLFPEPFGPTTQVIPGAKSNLVLSAKLLKPNNSRAFSIAVPRNYGVLRSNVGQRGTIDASRRLLPAEQTEQPALLLCRIVVGFGGVGEAGLSGGRP